LSLPVLLFDLLYAMRSGLSVSTTAAGRIILDNGGVILV
jgi:hypothetical protein